MASPASAFSGSASIVAHPEVATCKLGDGLALLDLEHSTYFSMNAVAAAIWERLREPATIAELEQLVAEMFETGDADVKADIVQLLTQLDDLHLIRISDA